MRTFLGCLFGDFVKGHIIHTDYYRTCIKNYAHIAEPLIQLTRKNCKLECSVTQGQVFVHLKEQLMSETIMAHPQPDKPYLLYTDTCDYAIGSILYQTDENGVYAQLFIYLNVCHYTNVNRQL